MEMSSRIPDRWIKYAALGKRIAHTPFVAFKCPLNEALSISLPPEDRFGPEDLKTSLPHLSLIIDLTNTNRYYNPKVLKKYGIEHEKILTPGHVIPPKDRFHRFFNIVDNFIQNNGANSDKLIGVHCTHGLNRTGLFICSYMICKLGYKYETAVEEFNSARGHTIERENYLKELKKFETKPLNFSSVSHAQKRQEPRHQRSVKPLMRLPPPLIPPHLIPHPVRYPPGRDRVQRYEPSMYPPRPLMESSSSFPYPRDRRPHRDSRDRRPPPPGRQPYPAFHQRSRSGKEKHLDWNWRRPRV